MRLSWQREIAADVAIGAGRDRKVTNGAGMQVRCEEFQDVPRSRECMDKDTCGCATVMQPDGWWHGHGKGERPMTIRHLEER